MRRPRRGASGEGKEPQPGARRHIAPLALAACVLVLAASSGPDPSATPVVRGPRDVRVAIASSRIELAVVAFTEAPLADGVGAAIAHHDEPLRWRIHRRGLQMRALSADGRNVTAWSEEPLSMVPERGEEAVLWNGKPYRGELRFVAVDTAILVINVVALESYLRGVVPLEIGTRQVNESAAIEAQAITARSYALVRALDAVARPYDLTSTVTDQAYGGRDVEQRTSDAAIARTEGMVLTFAGRAVRAPYHAACGGRTAHPSDVWMGGGDSFLTSVQDVDPATGRVWCDIAPKYQWERHLDAGALARAARTGVVLGARIEGRTASGRVSTLALETERETVRLKGNEIRFALRGVGGEILNSTYFSLEPVAGHDGRLTEVTVRGRGNGHGVGMCQWGAIGRARAGHRAHEILMAYYPGTVLGQLQR